MEFSSKMPRFPRSLTRPTPGRPRTNERMSVEASESFIRSVKSSEYSIFGSFVAFSTLQATASHRWPVLSSSHAPAPLPPLSAWLSDFPHLAHFLPSSFLLLYSLPSYMMALDSENEEERAATWNSFPKVNLRGGEAVSNAGRLTH